MFDPTHPLYREDLAGTLPYIEAAGLAGKRLHITGARGLIGSYLVDALALFNRESSAGKPIHIYAMGRDLAAMEQRCKTRPGCIFCGTTSRSLCQ